LGNNKEVFNGKDIFVLLDKPYLLKFTLAVVYKLEEIYGTMTAALESLFNEDTEQAIQTATVFLQLITKAKPEVIGQALDAKVFEAVSAALRRDFPDKKDEEEAKENSNDWDNLYYMGRYLLCMSDNEFWHCSPRRFFKLLYLWGIHHKMIEPEQEIYNGNLTYF